MIEPELLERLRATKDRTGMSESEQIRQGIRWWLESREWPLTRARSGVAGATPEPSDAGPSGTGRRARKRIP